MTVCYAGAYMFRAAMCPSSGELLYQCDIWLMSLCVDDRLVCRSICSCIHEKLCVKLLIYKDQAVLFSNFEQQHCNFIIWQPERCEHKALSTSYSTMYT